MLTKKRWICLCVVAMLLACCFSVVTVQAATETGTCGENLKWELYGNTLKISGKGDMYNYTKESPAPWAEHLGSVTTITVERGITGIGDYAFWGSGITKINIGSDVKRIGDYAFASNKSLEDVTIQAGTETIGVCAFDSCNLLETVTIPWTVTTIGRNAFRNCVKLKTVKYAGAEAGTEAISIGTGNEFLKAATWDIPGISGMCGDRLCWMIYDKKLVIYGTGDMYDYSPENPAPWNGYSNYSGGTIGEGITGIGAYAFYNCRKKYTTFNFPSTLRKIGSKAFADFGGTYYLRFKGREVTIAADAFLNTKDVWIWVPFWNEAYQKNYGAEDVDWKNGKLLFSDAQKKLVSIGGDLRPDYFQFNVDYTVGETEQIEEYIATDIQIGAYDNSSYGQKTINITVDGVTMPFTYYVTDGQNHLDLIEVSVDRCQEVTAGGSNLGVVVTAGNETLVVDRDYTLSGIWKFQVGQEQTVTVTGKGNFAGYSRKITVGIIKADIAGKEFRVYESYFTGEERLPKAHVYNGNQMLDGGEDYVCFAENNINPGTGKMRFVGIGDYTGSDVADIKIRRTQSDSKSLQGAYVGQADGTLTQEYYYSEFIMPPCECAFYTDGNSVVVESFALYRVYMDGSVQLIDTCNQNTNDSYGYRYDFSSVFDDVSGEGGHAYILEYAWVENDYEVYSGIAVFAIPSKVADAETMHIEELPDDEDFRRVYLDAWSEDGNIGEISWSTSNKSIATVNDGVVTFLKPGTVTITGKYGKASASQTLTSQAQPLGEALLIGYDRKIERSYVIYQGLRLEEGKDYTVSVTEDNGIMTVQAIGCGLFEGAILRQFDANTELPLAHTHVFSAVCDPSCETCDFVRESVHTLNPGWKRDADGHWHVCTLCGEQQDYEAHTFTDPDTCGICGSLNLPGDMNNDYEVTDADAVYLLRHTLFEESYPITRNGDFNKDGNVTDADAIYLLRHTLFGDSYPIQ